MLAQIAAHEWLFRWETNLRQAIDRAMTAAFGADWPRHRLPNNLYDQWVEKQRKDQQSGRPVQSLIAYADFTDYERVICKEDNWSVFSAVFQRKENVRESLQRLQPIRLCTMHARIITQDDQLLLYVEVKRFMDAIARLERS